MRSVRKSSVVVFSAWLVLAGLMLAQQSNTGQISGFILDPSGAAVPQAKITATEVLTGFERRTSCDAAGYFVLPNLPVGTYTLAAEQAGFKRAVQSGLTLGGAAKLGTKLTLEVGAVSESVEVTANAVPVESETAQVGRVVEAKQMLEIPVNGRMFGNYLMWLPGVTNARQPNISSPSDNYGIRRFFVNGTINQTHTTIDGVEAIRTTSPGASVGMLTADSIEELKVITSNYLPEYGRGAGAQIMYITSSGTKDFHGSAYEFLRNDALDARGYFNTSKQSLRYNNFGGTFGGPLYIPGKWNTSRQKLFFYYSGEFYRQRTGSQVIGIVPTPLEHSGDFRGSASFAAPIDPLSGLPFPNATVPQSRWSRNGAGFMKLYPAANANLPGGNFTDFGVNWSNQQIHQFKADYNFSQTRISASVNETTLHFENAFGGVFRYAREHQDRPGHRYGLTITTSLRPRLLNEFNLGYSAHNELNRRIGGGDRSQYGIDFPYAYPSSKNDYLKLPVINISSLSMIDAGYFSQIANRGPIYAVKDNITWIHGPHVAKFGFVVERDGITKDGEEIASTNGLFNFSGSLANPNTSRNALADVLLGNFDSYSELGNNPYTVFRSNGIDFYGQDSWKVTHNLVIEGGVRYNYWLPQYARWNNISFWDPRYFDMSQAVSIDATTGAIVPNSGNRYNGMVLPGNGWPQGAAGRFPFASDPASIAMFHDLPRGYVATVKNLIEPRLGFSWSPSRNTVVRGAAGIMHTRDVGYSNLMMMGLNYPFVQVFSVTNGSVDNPPGGVKAADNPVGASMFDSNLKVPVVYQYSFGVQRAMPGSVLLDIAYVGNRARNIFLGEPFTRFPNFYFYDNRNKVTNTLYPYPGYTGITKYANRAWSNYDSLQVSARKRYSHGLLVVANYTWSKNIENGQLRDQYRFDLDRGPSVLDRTHVFNCTFLYELPWLRHSKSFAPRMIGGWAVSSVVGFSTGLPLNVGFGGPTKSLTLATRPDAIANPNLPRSERTFDRYYDSSAFTTPEFRSLGNAGYNIMREAGDNNFDIAAMKNFALRESVRLQFRAEMFNAFNHPEVAYNGVNTTWGDPRFGRVTGMYPSRTIQLSLKLNF